MSEEKVVCKPGFNSCEIGDETPKKAVKKVEEAPADGEVVCKPGYNSCSIDGEPVATTPESDEKKGCKPGFNSCDI